MLIHSLVIQAVMGLDCNNSYEYVQYERLRATSAVKLPSKLIESLVKKLSIFFAPSKIPTVLRATEPRQTQRGRTAFKGPLLRFLPSFFPTAEKLMMTPFSAPVICRLLPPNSNGWTTQSNFIHEIARLTPVRPSLMTHIQSPLCSLSLV